MSSDPIEVLRKEASALLRVAEGCNEIGVIQGKASTIAFLCRHALASLSAPKHKAGDNMEAESSHVQGNDFRELARRALPFLHDEAAKYDDDGSNEPLELAREIESSLASPPPVESALPLANSAFDGGGEAPKPESAEAVIPWVREWKGSGPQRGFHIREATRLHNNRVVAYLGDQVDGDEVDKLIAEHNGKHPNGDPVRPAPPRPEASAPVVDRAGAVRLAQAAAYASHHTHDYLPHTAEEARNWQPHEWVVDAILAATLDTPPQQASAPVGDSLLQTALRNLPQYISKSGLVGPDKHSAMQCFEVLRDALAQQPAAVDEAMERVRRGPARLWQADLVGGQISVERMREILTAALAGQQQGGA